MITKNEPIIQTELVICPTNSQRCVTVETKKNNSFYMWSGRAWVETTAVRRARYR